MWLFGLVIMIVNWSNPVVVWWWIGFLIVCFDLL